MQMHYKIIVLYLVTISLGSFFLIFGSLLLFICIYQNSQQVLDLNFFLEQTSWKPRQMFIWFFISSFS